MHFSFDNILESHVSMSLVGYAVVFFVLVSLALIFTAFPMLIHLKNSLGKKAKGKVHEAPEDHSGEINAAIAMAVHLYYSELHDLENTILTIERRESVYSPWSSKLYGMRGFMQRPQRPSSFRLPPKRRSTDH